MRESTKKLIGCKYNKLTISSESFIKNGKRHWWCTCECGNKVSVYQNHIKTGHIKSCGCERGTHHKSDTHLSTIWEGMIQRCTNPKNKAYKNYGGRGITVCWEWRIDFMSFYNWANSNGYGDTLSIDRIENDLGYFPENCRWANRFTQNRNSRGNRKITHNGKTKILIEWCEELDLPYKTISARLNQLNWSVEDALTTPIKGR